MKRFFDELINTVITVVAALIKISVVIFVIAFVGNFLFALGGEKNSIKFMNELLPDEFHFSVKTSSHDDAMAIEAAVVDNSTADERITDELRKSRDDDFFRLYDNRLANISFAREQAGSTSQIFYRIKGEESGHVSKIRCLSKSVKEVIRKEANKEKWKKAEKEYYSRKP